jgi:DNA-binding transcriptional ArsR family regulator
LCGACLKRRKRHLAAQLSDLIDAELRHGSIILSRHKSVKVNLLRNLSDIHLLAAQVLGFIEHKTAKKIVEISLQNITPFGVMLSMNQLADVLTAISHPTRRAIIAQLANGPARFLDIAKPFDTALNAVTKHLKLLERAGLIERERKGREVFISFRGEPLRQVAGWVHEYERFWNERLDEFRQYFKDKKQKRRSSDEHTE